MIEFIFGEGERRIMSSVNRMGLEYLLRNVHLQSQMDQKEKNADHSYIVQTYQLLDEPVVVGHSLVEDTFQQRLAKIQGLGFACIYTDQGQALLFHREKSGFCAIDKTTCKIDSIFLNKDLDGAVRANGIAAMSRVLEGEFSSLPFIENFSYRDLPLISELDQTKLPVEESAEQLLGLTEKSQIEQFEESGYALGLDCSWALNIIYQSRERRQEAMDEVFHHKMECLPQEVQDFYGYQSSKRQTGFVKTKVFSDQVVNYN